MKYDTVKIQSHIGYAGYRQFYFDLNGIRFWFNEGYKRTTMWRSNDGEVVTGYVYPLYSYIKSGSLLHLKGLGK